MAGLLWKIIRYAAPRGNRSIRNRIIGAFICLVLAKTSNIFTPLIYGSSVDLVNGYNGFSMMVLWYLLGAYALSRLGQQIFSEAKEYLFSRVAQRAGSTTPTIVARGASRSPLFFCAAHFTRIFAHRASMT